MTLSPYELPQGHFTKKL